MRSLTGRNSAAQAPELTPSAQMTLPEAFAARVRATPSADAYIQHDAAAGVWRTWSWAAIGAEMERWRRALAAESIPPGERVAVMLPNCIEWVCFEQAALALGLVVVPLYVIDDPGNSAHILADSGASLLLVDSAGQWARLEPLRAGFPILQRVLCLRHLPGELDENDRTLLPCEPWLAGHGGSPPPPPETLGAETLATLIYTSGTTGASQGCDAEPRQHPVQRPCRARGRPGFGHRSLPLIPAAVPRLRADRGLLHSHAGWGMHRIRALTAGPSGRFHRHQAHRLDLCTPDLRTDVLPHRRRAGATGADGASRLSTARAGCTLETSHG